MINQLSLFDISFDNSIEDNSEEEVNSVSLLKVEEKSIESICKEKIKHTFVINEQVSLVYNGISYIGTVKRIYNNGDTINCTFDNGRKHSAFYVGNINKLKK